MTTRCESMTKNGIQCAKGRLATGRFCKIHQDSEDFAGPMIPGFCEAIKTNHRRCTREAQDEEHRFCSIHHGHHERHAEAHQERILEKQTIDLIVNEYKVKGTDWKQVGEEVYSQLHQRRPTMTRAIAYYVLDIYSRSVGVTQDEFNVEFHRLWNAHITNRPLYQ
jgi:hypothetical protein